MINIDEALSSIGNSYWDAILRNRGGIGLLEMESLMTIHWAYRERVKELLQMANHFLDEQPCPPGQHEWKSQQQGGDPAEIGSHEWVTYCKVCGIEYDED